MLYDNHILDALETVSTWDLPEEDLADAVSDQARLMGIVAVARRLVIALWKYLETGEIPAGAVLKPAV